MAQLLAYFPRFDCRNLSSGSSLVAPSHKGQSANARAGRNECTGPLAELGIVAAIVLCGWCLGNGAACEDPRTAHVARLLIESSIQAPLYALLIWQLARGNGGSKAVFSVKPLLVLGEASYGLYILQEPIYVWIRIVLKRIVPTLLERDGLVFSSYLVLLTAVSVLTYRYLETPLRKQFLRRFAPVRVVDKPPAVLMV